MKPIRITGFILSYLFAAVVFAQLFAEEVSSIVINEVHHNPPDNTVRQEFIELYNPLDEALSLDGWRLSGAVDFNFPEGANLAAKSYVVIAEDPDTIKETFNVSALGPYEGKLDSGGETIRLRNAEDEVVDLVDYRTGFPWPVAPSGQGASMELMNPELDNSLGSSWRPSTPQRSLGEAVLLGFANDSWSWRPGLTEASTPTDLWRTKEYELDLSWNVGAVSPIGYGRVNDMTINTSLDDMRSNYNCIFLRNTFEIIEGEIPSVINVNYFADDGFILWINGKEVERHNFIGDPSIEAKASRSGTEGKLHEVTVNNPGAFLIEGINTIAVQLFNSSTNNSDLGFDIEIVRPKLDEAIYTPSPGSRNTAFSPNAPPNIRKVNHFPKVPSSEDPVVISAKVTDLDGVGSVTLEYCIVSAGSYVPAKLPHPVPNIPVNSPQLENPKYEEGWVSVLMNDKGEGGDLQASDDVYSVTLPVNKHRTLVRYRIIVEDVVGKRARAPFSDDPSLNFAYFTYNGIPSYEGEGASALESLPVYHLLTRQNDYADCFAYNGSKQISQGTQARFYYNWHGTMFYDGIVYDNIRYRLRGANGRYHNRGKRSMRLRFNNGSYFQSRDYTGKKYPREWRTLTIGKGFDNRGTLTYGLNEAVSLYLFNKIGVPGPRTHWVHWRVIDDEEEAPDKWRGDFHGFNFILETYDVRFMESHQLEKGNLYKLINQTTSWKQQQRYQAAYAPNNGRDHSTIENQLDGRDSADFINAHVNLEKWNRWHALAEAIRHYDFWPSANKNMVYYFEPVYLPENNYNGKLWILPWDTDASWGPTWNSGHDVVYNSLFSAAGGGADGNSTPELWPAYFNEVRQLRDLLWQEDQINPIIEAFAAQLEPMEKADAARWKGSPSDAGTYSGIGGAGSSSIASLVRDMKNFAFSGGSWPGGSVRNGGRAAHLDSLQRSFGEGGKIPRKPTIKYIGDDGFNSNGLIFESSDFSDPQGSSTFEAIQWRLAEITKVNEDGLKVTPFFGLGSSWKYLDNGSDQGLAWKEIGFDDSLWSEGLSPLGYADNQVVTTIDFGGITSQKHLTTYFRKLVNIQSVDQFGSFTLGLQRDDGAVIYVNGKEVARSQMPAGNITYDTRASGSRDEDKIFNFVVPSEMFFEGDNLIAVEVHQASSSSSDMIFDLEMSGTPPPVTDPDSIKLEWDADWDTGPINDFEKTTKIPTAVIRSDAIYRARVRHQDNTGRWSNWSDPIEFQPSLPDLTNYTDSLIISEIMYHPGRPNTEEIEAGFDDDDLFEFIEIKNVGDKNLDLRDLRFTKGIDFDFLNSNIEFIGPQEHLLVVKNLKAFEMRYGSGLPIAGQWEEGDRLSNGGERIKLSFGAGDPIIDFSYDDSLPWSVEADGTGASLNLISETENLDFNSDGSWTSSSNNNGTPGKDDLSLSYDYDQWVADVFQNPSDEIAGKLKDPDNDGFLNLVEYALGTNPSDNQSIPQIMVNIVSQDGQEYLALQYMIKSNRKDVRVSLETSNDFIKWHKSEQKTQVFSTDVLPNGVSVVEGSNEPIDSSPNQKLRLHIESL